MTVKIIVHRGTEEIGGNCVEVRTDSTRIILDVGMPLVVAFAEAAAAELIHDDENGVLVEPGDTEAFVRGALRLAQGAEARQAMARQARISSSAPGFRRSLSS